MYEIVFYKDENGKEAVKDYIRDLSKKALKSKDAKIKYNKIMVYLKLLSEYGLSIGEPYIKHIEGELWELRPLRDRILFVSIVDNEFILLHYFMKDTQKTPKKEIEKALKNAQKYKDKER